MFIKYMKEIFEIQKKRAATDYPQISDSDAWLMFFTDVKKGTQFKDNTAGIISGVDFAALHDRWVNLSDAQQDEELHKVYEVMDNIKLMQSMDKVYPDGKAMEKLARDWLATAEAEKRADTEPSKK